MLPKDAPPTDGAAANASAAAAVGAALTIWVFVERHIISVERCLCCLREGNKREGAGQASLSILDGHHERTHDMQRADTDRVPKN